jgi:hypothetical protein
MTADQVVKAPRNPTDRPTFSQPGRLQRLRVFATAPKTNAPRVLIARVVSSIASVRLCREAPLDTAREAYAGKRSQRPLR